MVKITLYGALAAFCWTLWCSAADEPPKPAPDHDLEVRKYMVQISKEIGVTCSYCHNVNNFKSYEKPAMKETKDMIHIVKLLNAQGFTYKNAPKADCYMCHRGKAKPDYKMPVGF